MLIYYHISPGLAVFWLPLFSAFAVLNALAVGLWLSALNVQFRDVQHAIPFLVQVWMYASPVAYSSSLIEGTTAAWLYGMNPMVGCIEGFRWALLGCRPPDLLCLVSACAMFLLLASGLLYFRRMEAHFADIV